MRYQIIERIGHGSSGQVYQAEKKEDGTKVALKFMTAIDQDMIQMRRSEYQILRDLDHPNIASRRGKWPDVANSPQALKPLKPRPLFQQPGIPNCEHSGSLPKSKRIVDLQWPRVAASRVDVHAQGGF
ncbi:dst1 [Symbiodinium sp. CCMP2456]|nr:dst1 [Symbiodinium sp. CCMP2456]